MLGRNALRLSAADAKRNANKAFISQIDSANSRTIIVRNGSLRKSPSPFGHLVGDVRPQCIISIIVDKFTRF
jgi:hypothetical protein